MHIYANIQKKLLRTSKNKKNPAQGGIQKPIGKINN